MKKILLSILLGTTLSSFAYQDITWTHKDQNVHIRVRTGLTYVEIRNKAIILARLIQSASNELNYSGTIIINIDHDYINRFEPKTLVGYTKKDIYSEKHFSKFSVKRKCLRLYSRTRDIDYREVIRNVERCIQNINTLKEVDYVVRNERDRSSHLVDINQLTVLENRAEIFEKIKCEKVNRTIGDGPSDMNFTSISYFYECNEYHLYGLAIHKHDPKKDTLVLQKVPSIFQVARLSYHMTLIFDTDSTFFFLTNSESAGPKISERHFLSPTYGHYLQYEVTKVDDYIFIEFGGFLEKGGIYNRLLAYIIEEDRLVQDVKSRIENN